MPQESPAQLFEAPAETPAKLETEKPIIEEESVKPKRSQRRRNGSRNSESDGASVVSTIVLGTTIFDYRAFNKCMISTGTPFNITLYASHLLYQIGYIFSYWIPLNKYVILCNIVLEVIRD